MPLIRVSRDGPDRPPHRAAMVLLLSAWLAAVVALWVFWRDLTIGWRIAGGLLVALTTPSVEDIRWALRGR